MAIDDCTQAADQTSVVEKSVVEKECGHKRVWSKTSVVVEGVWSQRNVRRERRELGSVSRVYGVKNDNSWDANSIETILCELEEKKPKPRRNTAREQDENRDQTRPDNKA